MAAAMTLRRLTSAIILLNVGLVAALFAYSASADQQGMKIEGKAPAEYVAGQSGESWAVVIGIDDYDLLPRLNYAVADAKAVARLLEKQGFHVVELYDKAATRRAIQTVLGSYLMEFSGEEDQIVIFFAGHGVTQGARGYGKEMGFLVPSNGRPKSLADSAISMALIQELADGLPSKHVLFFVDACYAGIAGQRSRGRPEVTDNYYRLLTREMSRQLITAGGGDQEALEGPQWGHSVFTYYLLEGLGKGLADLNNDGIVPAAELHFYLEQRVFEAAQMKNHKQRPELWTLVPEKGEFVFVLGKQGRDEVKEPPRRIPAPEQDQAALKKRIEEQERKIEELEKKLAGKLREAEQPGPSERARVRLDKDGASIVLVPAGEFLLGETGGPSATARPPAGGFMGAFYGTVLSAGEFLAQEFQLKPYEGQPPVWQERRVHLDAFYLDRYEVTTAQYAGFLNATNRIPPMYWKEAQLSQRDRPVIGVDWEDANAYCAWTGKRLPTDAEWEAAARGTDGRPFPWGNESPNTALANYGKTCPLRLCNVYESKLKPVGSYESGKSPFDAYDLLGNASEWVANWYEDSDHHGVIERNPQGPAKGAYKIVRGGSWASEWDYFQFSASGFSKVEPSVRSSTLGFRCAQDAPK